MKPFALLALAALGATAPAQAIHGTLVDTKGKPLAGVRLSGIAAKRMGERYEFTSFLATTGKDGRFTLAKSPALPTARAPIMLMARLPDGRFTPIRLAAQGGKAVWTLPKTVTLTVRTVDDKGSPVPGATARLTGAIIGNPSAPKDSKVFFHARIDEDGPAAKTDAQGVARIVGIPAGVSAWYQVSRDALTSVRGDFSAGESDGTVDATLKPGAIVSGRVLRAGKPVPGVEVVATTLVDHMMQQARAKTNANGEYRIGGAYPGTVKLSADLGALAKDWVAIGPDSVTMMPGQERNGLNLVLDPGVLLKGHVLTQDGGKPVPKAAVAVSGRGGGYFRLTSDAQGRFSARVAPGGWYVSIDDVDGVPLNRQVSLDANIDAEHNPPLDLMVPDAALLPPIANLAGTVTGADGKLVEGASVRNLTSREEAKTDATGRFRFAKPTNPGSLVVALKDGAMSRRATAVLDKPTLALALDGKATTLQGALTDEEGKPLSGAEVTLGGQLDKGYVHVPGTTTDASGAYRFENLYGGLDYFFLWAKKPGYGPVTIQPIKTAPGESKTLETMKMALADGVIDGTVLDPEGKPAAGVTVSSQVSDVPTVLTDAQGRFHLTGVPRGKHFVVASRTNSYGSGAVGTTGQKDVVIKLQPESKPIAGLVSGDRTGSAAPEIKVAAWTNNGPVDLKALKGKIVVIDLWAVWCGPCVASLPDVQKLSAKYAGRGVTVIGIHAPGTPKEKVAAFAKEKGLTYPVALDVEEASGVGVTAKAFGFTGIPHVLVIDAKGRVVADTNEVEDAEKAIRKLLGED